MKASLALSLALVLVPVVSLADPPPPKVCVAVAGDPDEAVRALADDVSASIGQQSGMRGVADVDTRNALRGGTATTDDTADYVRFRRSLRMSADDNTALDAMGERLGCAVWVTLATRPAGTGLRVYDVRRHHAGEIEVVSSLDASRVVHTVETTLSAPADGGSSNASRPSASHVVEPSRPAAPRPLWRRALPWVALGALSAAVVGAFFLTQDTEPTSTRIQVIHRGGP